MQIDILTLFPKMFMGPFHESMIKRAQEKNLVEIKIYDLRKWGEGERKTVDDKPYGGGAGMILRVDIIDHALRDLKLKVKSDKLKIILLDATGEKFNQKKANEYSKLDQLVLIAGHYEGVDHRVHEHLANEVISIGDYVLSGGEIPAMVIVDSVVRLLPGALGNPTSLSEESFSKLPARRSPEQSRRGKGGKIGELKIENFKEYPQYTRPENYKDWQVPKVLLTGNHAEIKKWRLEQAKKRTAERRPDLIRFADDLIPHF